MKWVLIVFTTTLFGCGAKANHVYDAVEKCSSHKGIAELWPDAFGWHARCIDGTTYYNIGINK